MQAWQHAALLLALFRQFRRQLHSLRHHDDGEALALLLALADEFADAVDAERDFGDKHDVRAARQSTFQSDPANVAPHHFDQHDAVMRLRRGVDLVDGFGSGVQRGIETEGHFGGAEVVVNGLGHANHRQATAMQIQSDLLRAVTAHHDERVQAQSTGVVEHALREIAHDFLPVLGQLVLERIAAVGGTEDGSTPRQNAADALRIQPYRLLGPDQPVKTVADADHLPSVFLHRTPYRRPDHRVQSGTIATASANADGVYLAHPHASQKSSILAGTKTMAGSGAGDTLHL